MLLKRRLAVLVATASIAVMMLLAMAPVVLALPEPPNRGQSPFPPPPGGAPGAVFRDPTADEHDQHLHPTGPRP